MKTWSPIKHSGPITTRPAHTILTNRLKLVPSPTSSRGGRAPGCGTTHSHACSWKMTRLPNRMRPREHLLGRGPRRVLVLVERVADLDLIGNEHVFLDHDLADARDLAEPSESRPVAELEARGYVGVRMDDGEPDAFVDHNPRADEDARRQLDAGRRDDHRTGSERAERGRERRGERRVQRPVKRAVASPVGEPSGDAP